MNTRSPSFPLPDLSLPAETLAPLLIGCVFMHGKTGGIVIETEAYGANDPASHSFNGRTKRNGSMFGKPGTVYVYRSYGIHRCVNIVCGKEGTGEAVLIRAVRPLAGIDTMKKRRGTDNERLLCAGPGRLCEALGITLADDGSLLNDGGLFVLKPRAEGLIAAVKASKRIGISKAADKPFRFCLTTEAKFLSRPA